MLKIKDFLKNKKVFKKNDSNIKPDLYWAYIVDITMVLVLASFVFGFYFFMSINNTEEVDISGGYIKSPVDQKKLDEVLDYFKQREVKSSSILNSVSSVIDPSL